jgi:hypothetical protein
MYATSDGGSTWTAQDSGTTHDLWSLAFVDVHHGWAGGDVGTIIGTKTGGFSRPMIAGFSPSSAPVGASVTITGTGFVGATAVTFSGTPATFVVDSDAQITATVPAGATTGRIAVAGPGGEGTAATDFAVVPAPSISSLKPSSGRRGAIVTVTGSGFGASRGLGSVTFGGKRCTKYISWSETRISCKVPAQARFGLVKVAVTTKAGVSNAKDFTVKR